MSMTADEIRAFGEEWVDNWAHHRSAEAMKHFADDCEYVGPIRRFSGIDNIRAFVEGFFNSYPDEKWELRQAYADAPTQTLVFEWIDSATMQAPWPLPGGGVIEPTGRQYRYVGCDVIQLDEEGKIRHWEEYFDTLIMMKQLGIVEPFVAGMREMVSSSDRNDMLATTRTESVS